MVKLVHVSDTHFDSIFAGMPPETAEVRRDELLVTFEEIIDRTKEYGADMLLLPGDLFENDYVTYKTAEFLKRAFSKIPETYVFIAPGNHDCISGNEIYGNMDLGENVIVFGAELQCITIEEKKCRVYGYGFQDKFHPDSCMDGFSAPDDEYINILVIHASLPPYDRQDYNPISLRQIEESNLNYIAAGHIHLHEGIKKAGKTLYAYCGIPEGRHFDEKGDKGIIMGELSKKKQSLEFVHTAKRKLLDISIDVSDCLSYNDICNKIKDLDKNNLYNIALTGLLQKDVYFDTSVLAGMLEVFYARVTDETQAPTTRDRGIMENLFIEKVSCRDKGEKIKNQAIKLGLDALSGKL